MPNTPIASPSVSTESELKVIPSRELQIKLMASLRGDSAQFASSILQNAFELGAYQITHVKRVTIVDEYIDTPDFLLNRTHRTFRVRQREGKISLTAKEPKGFDLGEFLRDERDWKIDQAVYDLQLSKGFADYRAQLKDVGNSPLSVKLKVINERDLYSMTGAQEEYELAVDIFSYANTLTGQTSSQQFEIEVEAKNDAAATRIPSMKSKLLSLLTSRGYDDFRFSEDSKYERGVKIMQLWQPTWLQYFSAWATRSNAALIMLILGVLGFVVGVVAIVVAK